MSANTSRGDSPNLVTNCLGESRPVTSAWLDGSYNCPFCEAPVPPSYHERPCPNPMREASPYAKPEEILRRRAQLAKSEREAAQRRAQTEQMIAHSQRWQAQQTAEVAAASNAGYCVRCFIRSGHRRCVRHRTPDYHDQQAR